MTEDNEYMAQLLKEIDEARGEAKAGVVRTQFSIKTSDFEAFQQAVLAHYGPTVQVNAKLMKNGGKHPTLKIERCPLALTRLTGEGPGGSLQVWVDRVFPKKRMIVTTDGGLVLTREDLDNLGVEYKIVQEQ
jgi:hypothetical protein